MSDGQLNHFLGVLVEGGADTTSSSILTLVHCLSRHPEHQRRAQKEIDAICGTDRYGLFLPDAINTPPNCHV